MIEVCITAAIKQGSERPLTFPSSDLAACHKRITHLYCAALYAGLILCLKRYAAFMERWGKSFAWDVMSFTELFPYSNQTLFPRPPPPLLSHTILHNPDTWGCSLRQWQCGPPSNAPLLIHITLKDWGEGKASNAARTAHSANRAILEKL